MIEFISGKIREINPAYVVIETAGLGYLLNISINTFSALAGVDETKILVHEVIREDSHQLYGFAKAEERRMFRLLISVSGIGANTARMMLSSLSSDEVAEAIASANVTVLKGIKGIGLKTAQRIIVDLSEKVGSTGKDSEIFNLPDNTTREEALSALVMLGFPRNASVKIVDKLISDNRGITVEELVKQSLKNL